MTISFTSDKYKLSICSFWEYYYIAQNSCSSKECLVDDRKAHKICSSLNLTIISIKAFTCNNKIFSVSFLNEITEQKKWSFPLRISSVNVTKPSFFYTHEWYFLGSYFYFLCYLGFQQDIKLWPNSLKGIWFVFLCDLWFMI